MERMNHQLLKPLEEETPVAREQSLFSRVDKCKGHLCQAHQIPFLLVHADRFFFRLELLVFNDRGLSRSDLYEGAIDNSLDYVSKANRSPCIQFLTLGDCVSLWNRHQK